MGGNAQIGDVVAQRIDLTQINRRVIVETLSAGLYAINDSMAICGIHLWDSHLISSRKFLSGSTIHLFDFSISDDEFLTNKRFVGDIDVQIDSAMAKQVENFLTFLPIGFEMSSLRYIGFKKSAGSLITLWNIPELDLNVQIDMEFVSFENGEPTEWSRFSHGCSWDDIRAGVKGVFHKYLLRSLQARLARYVRILPKTERGEEKIVCSSSLAFSFKGLRTNLQPVLIDGKHLIKDGLPVYIEIRTKDSFYDTDFSSIFNTLFGRYPQSGEIKELESFIGIVSLMNRYFDTIGKQRIIDRFANLLWGKDAQRLVRDNPTEDFETKCSAFAVLEKEFGVSRENYREMIESYYQSYR